MGAGIAVAAVSVMTQLLLLAGFGSAEIINGSFAAGIQCYLVFYSFDSNLLSKSI